MHTAQVDTADTTGIPNATRLCVLGIPGAGKTTQASLLAEVDDVEHITIESIIALGREAEMEQAERAQELLDAGEFIPNEVLHPLVEHALVQEECVEDGFVLDAYPRTPEDIEHLVQIRLEPTGAFILQCSGREAQTRLEADGKTFNVARVREFNAMRQKLERAFEKAGVVVMTIDGNQSKGDVAKSIDEEFEVDSEDWSESEDSDWDGDVPSKKMMSAEDPSWNEVRTEYFHQSPLRILALAGMLERK